MRETQFNKYPDFLVNMIELYQEKFKKELIYYLTPIYLISKEYEKAKGMAGKYSPFSDDDQNELFRKLLMEICDEFIGLPF